MPLIQYLSRINFDFGALAALGEEIRSLGISRPLLVTDPQLAEAGFVDRALDAAAPVELVVFDRTPGNPTEAALSDCLELWRSERCDGVISMGGGSSIDLGKAVALIASHGGRFGEFGVTEANPRSIGKVAPQIAIPTAAGTGAEVGRASVLTLDNGRKIAAVSHSLIADTVICDPDLTLTLPQRMTAATGVDALTHGIEAFLSTRINPPAEAIALDCVRRVAQNLEAASNNGSDRKARWEMMMAALMGGMVLQKGLGCVHAMANTLGELGLRHGTLIAVLLPHGLRFNRDEPGQKYDALRHAIGLAAGDELDRWVENLTGELGLPDSLGEMGVEADQISMFADKASKGHLGVTNPRPVAVEDYETMLRKAM